ncbi:MAG: rhodanese-like domain-containing protein [Clostridia bacterium]|nr:rhodanese-like domain-containing protein [Clostridia bacterium]
MVDIKIDNNNLINYNQLKEMEKYNNVILIDVRSRQEFYESHIKGAINIPLINIKRYKFSYDQMIVLYCNAGIRSVKAKKILELKGYKNIYILEPNN